MKLLNEGKAKRLYRDDESESYLLEFSDDFTAFNGATRATVSGKGQICANISARLFTFLERQGVAGHFLQHSPLHCLRVRPLEMIPLEVIVRNRAAGSICKRLNIAEGTEFARPLVQYHLKDDSAGDPMLTEEEAVMLGLASAVTMTNIENRARAINGFLKALFDAAGMHLADFKLEFGFDEEGNLRLGDELSPDNMRLWEENIGRRLDKDLFRHGLAEGENLLSAYRMVLHRINLVLGKSLPLPKRPTEVELEVFPKPGILDPTGRTLAEACRSLGFEEVESVRTGKTLTLLIRDYRVGIVEELCQRLLASPAAEDYRYRLL